MQALCCPVLAPSSWGSRAELSDERLQRWRLVLGSRAEDGARRRARPASSASATRRSQALYEGERRGRPGRLGAQRRALARRHPRATSRPASCGCMQQDAIERLGLRQMLLEPELLATRRSRTSTSPHPALAAASSRERTRETARPVVRKVVDEVEQRLDNAAQARPSPARLDRATRTRRPRQPDIDWDRTVRANLPPLPPRAPHGHRREADRPRPPAVVAARRDPVRRPERLDGDVGRLLRASSPRSWRRSARCRHPAGGLRHRGRRPDRAARRSRRGPVRHAARRRHRHQPRRRLLPAAHHAGRRRPSSS